MQSKFLSVEDQDEPPDSRADILVPFSSPSFEESSFYTTHFPKASPADWNDWRWQLRNRITSLAKLETIVRLTESERLAFQLKSMGLPFAITPYYASLIDPVDPDQSIRRAMIPVAAEMVVAPGEAHDPLGEEGHSPVAGIVHRYPDRVLFLVTDDCSSYCRYCTRSRLVGRRRDGGRKRWQQALDYIAANDRIRDVLISGGDPLTLGDDQLDWLLARLRAIAHVEIIRIGTKIPMVMPQRITPSLTAILRKYHPLWISIHAMHPDELTDASRRACTMLADSGIPLGAQTVLLSGINDSVETMRRLNRELMKIRVKPYYLYQCDPIVGSSHFRTSVATGLAIYEGLRGHTSGYGVPTYVIDAPGGGGKIPLLPQTVVGRRGTELLLKNFEGKIYSYPDTAVAERQSPPSCGQEVLQCASA